MSDANSRIAATMEKQMCYDLLEAPDGYETDLVLVIVPYFDPSFAQRLVERLAPNRLRFVLDDGARWEDIKALQEACVGTDVKVALGSARGIVHLKGFYFEFVKSYALHAFLISVVATSLDTTSLNSLVSAKIRERGIVSSIPGANLLYWKRPSLLRGLRETRGRGGRWSPGPSASRLRRECVGI